MNKYEEVKADLRQFPKRWLITGVAGFIGSNLLEALLKLDQHVVGIDNFSTGKQGNIEEVRSLVSPEQWARFRFIEGDVCSWSDSCGACDGVDYVLHQAALGSVPRSIAAPLSSHASNVDGFIKILTAARDARARRFVFASSSSVYGDHPALPKREVAIGHPLSPYAATKLIDEIYASVFHRCFQTPTIGLRYFNVFGPRQDPDGAYAAVIPKWFAAILSGKRVHIFGDGTTSRDFCYVDNVVQANILAATVDSRDVVGKVYNIAYGERTTLAQLFQFIRNIVMELRPSAVTGEAIFGAERAGDVKHSLAEIKLARLNLGYAPTHAVKMGLREAALWYIDHLAPNLAGTPSKNDEGR